MSVAPDLTTRPLSWSMPHIARLAALMFLIALPMDNHTLTPWSPDEELEAQTALGQIEAGSLARRLAFAALACVGAALALQEPLDRRRMPGLWGALLAASVAWCLASVTWSVDTALSVRRLAVLLCFLCGAWGLSRQMRPRDLAELTAWVCLAMLALGVAVEVARGTFLPLRAEFRFAGTNHPNTAGTYAGLACVALTSLLPHAVHGRRWLWAGLAAGLALLILSKSRTAVLATTIAVTAGVVLRWKSTRKTAWLAAAVATLGTILLAAHLLGTNLPAAGQKLLRWGRDAEVEDWLDGRTPMWNELGEFIRQRPLAGYGYGAFWTPERVDYLNQVCGWRVTEAHSAYLETLLALGAVGLLLLLPPALGGGWRAWRLHRQDPAAGYDFLFCVLLYTLANGFTEAMLVDTRFVPMINLCGVLYVLRREEPQP